jgi:precorrin-6B methylase 2
MPFSSSLTPDLKWLPLSSKFKGSSTAPWKRTTAVRLGPRFSMDLAGSDLRLDVNGIQKQFPRGILQLLAFYQEPHTLEEGLHLLAPSTKGMQGLAEAFTRLLELCEQGVLVPDNGAPRSNWQPDEQVYGPSAQIRMLEDRVRTLRFIRAIRRTVRSGDVVVDLGTGSGVLAVAAAQAGAKHVYAIEVRPIADVAARLFQASGLSDRITLIRGTSTEIELPERADVLVSEMIGNEPLGERILETTCDAVARLLKPGARLIPSALRIYATPVVVPKKVRERAFFTPEVVDRWQRWYGVPFCALLDPADVGATQVSLVRMFVDPWTARRWPLLGPPVLLQAFDLAVQYLTPLTSEATLVLEREGELGGLLVHFEADLAAAVRITTEPACVSRRNHWRTPLWLLPSILKMHGGVTLSARLGFRNWNSIFEILLDQPQR